MVALLAAAPVAAAPNTDGDNGPVLGAGLLSTPMVQGRAWTVGFNMNTLSDTNFRRTKEPEAGVRLTPSVSAAVGLPVGRQQLFLGGDFGRDYLLGNPEFNRNRSSIGGGVAWKLGSRCSGVVGAEYSSRLSFVFDQAELTDNVQNTDVIAASASCQTATGLGFAGSVRKSGIRNERPERAAFDLDSTTYSPSISYGTPTIGQFSLSGNFNNVSYPNRFAPTIDGPVGEGVRILSGRLGYSRNLGSRLQLSFGGSYLKTTPSPGVILAIDANGQVVQVPRDSFTGSGFDFSLDYSASSRLSIGIMATRNVRVSPNVGALFIVAQGYSANVNYKLSSKLDAGVGATHYRNDYRGSFTTPDEVRLRNNDTTTRVYAQLDYSPVALYSIGVVVAHQQRNADPDDFDFKSTTALLRLRVKFGRG
ncbi:outer membrane beta-barrel protein [Polymorphobacter fuscus]|uniref:Outer membrane beta-barrel protein n=1 Tax=Sandarakinorhabdus fusca TaxID=1439888 RepID=A0A7C9GTP2_9SPHN|nr:outer membrane beta-barrel protein [Polymorphobacter fuscus]KAB7648928.1 outer membrane beta-barrel protein [Polymorphobacter fuscus]MQT16518.1 outer membrane beta-barrel protein [Polymorphobacter fuscus]NJC07192.1 hypothetical protein [Polymorphobacter fuscus]